MLFFFFSSARQRRPEEHLMGRINKSLVSTFPPPHTISFSLSSTQPPFPSPPHNLLFSAPHTTLLLFQMWNVTFFLCVGIWRSRDRLQLGDFYKSFPLSFYEVCQFFGATFRCSSSHKATARPCSAKGKVGDRSSKKIDTNKQRVFLATSIPHFASPS